MTRLCGAHNIIGGCIEGLAHFLKLRGGAISQLLGAYTLTRGCLLHLLAMFIHACDKQHIIPCQTMITGDGISCDALISMANMGSAIGIGNGCGDVKCAARSHGLSCKSESTQA